MEMETLLVTLLTSVVTLTFPRAKSVAFCSLVKFSDVPDGKALTIVCVYCIVRFTYMGAGSMSIVLYCCKHDRKSKKSGLDNPMKWIINPRAGERNDGQRGGVDGRDGMAAGMKTNQLIGADR